jgi:hypothetical protein
MGLSSANRWPSNFSHSRNAEAGKVDRQHLQLLRQPAQTGANAKMLSGHGLKSTTFSPPLPFVA